MIKTVIRKCFFNNSNYKPLFNEKLEIIGLGTANLSYSLCDKTGLVYQSKSLSTWEVKITLNSNSWSEISRLLDVFDWLLKPWKPVKSQKILYKGTEK